MGAAGPGAPFPLDRLFPPLPVSSLDIVTFLIYPPVSRSTEPPLGLARLSGFLRANGAELRALDFCQEGFEYLLGPASEGLSSDETWTRGALKRRGRAAASLRDIGTYANPGRYARAVSDLGRVLKVASAPSGAEVGLADYERSRLSPLNRADLLESFRNFGESPFIALYRERLSREFSASEPETVGLAVNFLSQALEAFALAGLVRQMAPRAKLLMGGGLISSWLALGRIGPEEDFGGGVDGLIAGPGEEPLAAHIGLPVEKHTAVPDFSDFEGLSYFAPGPIVPYNFSFGCPWLRCTFCPEKAEKSRYLGAKTDVAAAEIGELARRWSPILFHFTDNEISPLYLRALAARPPGAPWYGFARFTPLLADPGFCASLAASGCRLLQLGLESGDQGVLDALDKGIDLGVVERALSCLREAGIGVYIYILFGTPAEDRGSALRTRDFLARNARGIAFINVAIFNMPVTSPEATVLSTRPFYEGDLGLYCEFAHPRGWNRGEIRDFIASELEGEPSIRAILRRNPPIFTSNHAPFFVQPRT